MATDKPVSSANQYTTSLRLRVLLVSLAWIALALLGTGYVLNQLFEHHVRQQYQRQLQVYADYVLTGIEVSAEATPRLDASPQNPRFLQPLSGLYWQLNDSQGRAVLRSRSLWDQKLQAPTDQMPGGQAHFHLIAGPQGEELLLLEQIIRFEAAPEQTWRLLVAEDAQELTSSIRDWQQMLTLFLLVLFVSLGIAAIGQVVIGLSPLRRLQVDIKRLQSGDSSRLEGAYPQEFSGLIDGLNGVLDTNERMVERARSQAGDLAHALKTPLTVISTAIDQAKPGGQGTQDLARLVGEQVASIRAQVDWHLRRARIVAQSCGMSARTTLVEPVMQQMLKVMQKLYAHRGVQFRLELTQAGLKFLGEAHDLTEMIGNLLDNAGKWAKSFVLIRVSFEAGQITIEIQDDGPGISADRRVEALRRGVRMDERVPGSGLGLSIVSDLAQSYRGSLGLEASTLGGLAACLRLPGRPGEP